MCFFLIITIHKKQSKRKFIMPRSCGGGNTATDENAPKKNEKELDQRWEFMKENKKVRKP